MAETVINQMGNNPSGVAKIKPASGANTSKVEPKENVPQSKYDAEEAYLEPSENIRAEMQKIADDLNKMTDTYNRRLDFTVDEELGQVIVKIVDKRTDKVIKEVPPKELRRVHQRIVEAMGLIFDEVI